MIIKLIIKTPRLNIYPASNEQMKNLIAEQSLPELKEAYSQMLSGCLENPEHREWYAVWNIELNTGNNAVVGNLSFKGLRAVVQNGVKFIEAETEINNIASKRVLEKAGFALNGEIGKESTRYVWKR